MYLYLAGWGGSGIFVFGERDGGVARLLPRGGRRGGHRGDRGSVVGCGAYSYDTRMGLSPCRELTALWYSAVRTDAYPFRFETTF